MISRLPTPSHPDEIVFIFALKCAVSIDTTGFITYARKLSEFDGRRQNMHAILRHDTGILHLPISTLFLPLMALHRPCFQHLDVSTADRTILQMPIILVILRY